MMRGIVILGAIAMGAAALAGAQSSEAATPSVRVEPAHLAGPRQLAEQTEQGVIRDYLQSWRAMSRALQSNQPGLLKDAFVGTAKNKLVETIREQKAAGIHTRYQDLAHDLRLVFYSPDGLSIELVDNVDYNVRVFNGDQLISTRQAHARDVVVLTPAEVRWRVRVMQAE